MRRSLVLSLAACLAALPLAASAQEKPAAAPAPTPAVTPTPTPTPVTDPALASWAAEWFPWGAGEVVAQKAPRTVPGWTAWTATKSYTAPMAFQDRADLLVSEDGKTVLVGNLFVDEERVPAPIATNDDLASVRAFLKSRFLGPTSAKLALEPARDMPGLKGLAIAIGTGYGSWTMPAAVSTDGTIVFLGRTFRRDKGITAQRREAIDLSDTPSEGPADAKVTVVEYSDMQCPMCKRRSGELPALLDRLRPELSVRRFIKTYPLTEIHPWSFRAASAARCFFHKDPKLFFSFKANVFSRQEQLDVGALDAFVTDFAIANSVPDVMKGCYLSDANDARTLMDLSEGFSLGVRSTPSFFVDGQLVVWFDDPFMEEYLRTKFLGGKGLPIRTPTPTPAPTKAPAPIKAAPTKTSG